MNSIQRLRTRKDEARLTKDIVDSLTDFCAVGVKVRVENGVGGSSEQWQFEIPATTPCSVAKAKSRGETGRAVDPSGKVRAQVWYILTVPHGTELKEGGQVRCNDVDYTVFNVHNPLTANVPVTAEVLVNR